MDIQMQKVDKDLMWGKPDENALGFGQYFADHMFLMRYDKGRGWHDLTIKGYHELSLDPAAMVLHYGQAIFEGLKAYRGKDNRIFLFRPEDNLKRMNVSAERMCMPTIPVAKVLEGLKERLSKFVS